MPAFVMTGGVWRDTERPQVNYNGVRQVEQGWILNGGVWKPIWETFNLPLSTSGWVHTGGRGDGGPGIYFWGNTRRYCYFSVERFAPITGVVIEVQVDRGSGGNPSFRPGDSGDEWWTSGRGTWRSPMLNTWIPPGQEFRIYGWGHGDSGDAKIINYLKVLEIRYG